MTAKPVGAKASIAAARALLSEHRVEAPPVPLEAIAGTLNIEVVYEPLATDTSSVLIRQPNGWRVIGINSRHAHTRQRFSFAHELGHAVLHFEHQRDGEGAAIVDRPLEILYRDGVATLGTDKVEIDANRFAAELLMPEHFVRSSFLSALQENRRRGLESVIVDVADAFDVSAQAMTYRLMNLHLVDPT